VKTRDLEEDGFLFLFLLGVKALDFGLLLLREEVGGEFEGRSMDVLVVVDNVDGEGGTFLKKERRRERKRRLGYEIQAFVSQGCKRVLTFGADCAILSRTSNSTNVKR
jgi:isocitrate/isopropylmalate dehydrogenase